MPFDYVFAAPPVNLRGRLLMRGSGDPAASATLAIDDRVLTTDENGFFQARNLRPGGHVLRLLDEQLRMDEQPLTLASGELLELELWAASELREQEIVGLYERSRRQVVRRTLTAEQVRKVYDTADRVHSRSNGRAGMGRLANSLLKRIRDIEFRAMDSSEREFVCLAGSKMVVISHDGKVYPCEPLWLDQERKKTFPQEAMMGDLRETGFDIRPILASERARSIRSDVDKKYCACMYGCAMYNGLLFAPSTYPATVREFLTPRRKPSGEAPLPSPSGDRSARDS